MAYQPPAPDIPLQVTVPSASKDDKSPQISAERRINPSWTISQLKAKLEPITGIPPGCQHLRIRGLDGEWVVIGGGGGGETDRQWAGCRRVGVSSTSTTPPQPAFTAPSLSSVEKYTMPAAQYASLPSTVLAYKRSHQLRRFDPQNSADHRKPASELAQERTARDEAVITRGSSWAGGAGSIARMRGGAWSLCRGSAGLGGRGRGSEGAGSVRMGREGGGEGQGGEGEGKRKEEMKRLFECQPGFGVVVRPEKVEVGEEWTPLDDLGLELDDEEEEL
ncbi:hypothetical protein GJ744_005615 [Endocarpon pusillum]|uniref:Ubiquitin-like domain-containing protein n=1 Tax=Endocarpon pusillum TaxID=364733 RepID=A0A8H7DZI4_9EURO|nr:hypothetical protein GJ744_005615 [Endocarpon pusillum]